MGGIFDLLGKVNNLDDPEPALNKPPVVLGLVISFLVSGEKQNPADNWARDLIHSDPLMGVCRLSTLRSFPHRPISRMG